MLNFSVALNFLLVAAESINTHCVFGRICQVLTPQTRRVLLRENYSSQRARRWWASTSPPPPAAPSRAGLARAAARACAAATCPLPRRLRSAALGRVPGGAAVLGRPPAQRAGGGASPRAGEPRAGGGHCRAWSNAAPSSHSAQFPLTSPGAQSASPLRAGARRRETVTASVPQVSLTPAERAPVPPAAPPREAREARPGRRGSGAQRAAGAGSHD